MFWRAGKTPKIKQSVSDFFFLILIFLQKMSTFYSASQIQVSGIKKKKRKSGLVCWDLEIQTAAYVELHYKHVVLNQSGCLKLSNSTLQRLFWQNFDIAVTSKHLTWMLFWFSRLWRTVTKVTRKMQLHFLLRCNCKLRDTCASLLVAHNKLSFITILRPQ